MSDQAELEAAEHIVFTNKEKLTVISERILDRDRTLLQSVCVFWFQNGRDLIEAKSMTGHGRFESWCKETLNYSKSKAEKLMRTAEVFGPWLETVTITDLPPPTLLYELSAPSTPQMIRDEYLPRVMAKEKGVGPKLKGAIKQHREDLKRAAHPNAETSGSEVVQDGHKTAQVVRFAGKPEEMHMDRKRQAAARARAIDLISARLGDDLACLGTLITDAGPGNVFNPAVETELQLRATFQAATKDLECEANCNGAASTQIAPTVTTVNGNDLISVHSVSTAQKAISDETIHHHDINPTNAALNTSTLTCPGSQIGSIHKQGGKNIIPPHHSERSQAVSVDPLSHILTKLAKNPLKN